MAPHEAGLPTVEYMNGVKIRRFRYFLPAFSVPGIRRRYPGEYLCKLAGSASSSILPAGFCVVGNESCQGI